MRNFYCKFCQLEIHHIQANIWETDIEGTKCFFNIHETHQPDIDLIIMANKDRCTFYPQHILINQGRNGSLFGDVYKCDCGEWELGNKDESRMRIESRRDTVKS